MITIVKVLLIVVEVICALLLIGVVLLQRAKGEGLGLAFGTQMGESLFGARASNVLVRITIWLGVIFLAATLGLVRIYSHGSGRPLLERAQPVKRSAPVERQAAPNLPVLPALPAQAAPGQPPPVLPAPAPASPIIPTEAVPPAPAAAMPAAPVATPEPDPAPVAPVTPSN